MSSPDTTIGSPAAPTENHVKGVAALSPTDVWAVGYYNSGTSAAPLYQTLIEHYDGTNWQVDPTSADQSAGSPAAPTDNELLGIAATSATDVWAVGYYNSGTSAAPLYQTLIEHYDGTNWQVDPSSADQSAGSPAAPTDNELLGIAATSATDVWAVGYYNSGTSSAPLYQTLIEHYDGTNWQVDPSSADQSAGSPAAPTDNELLGIAATSATDVWAVGYYNSGTSAAPLYQTLIEHYDGTNWQVDPSSADQSAGSPAAPTDNELLGIAATSATDVWAVGYYNSGTSSAPLYQTLIEHYDGTNWQVDPSSADQSAGSPAAPTDNELLGIAATSATDVWAVGYYNSGTSSAPLYQTLIEHYDGTNWQVVASPDTTIAQDNVLTQVAAVSSSDLWAVGSADIVSDTQTVSQTLVEGTPTPSTTDISSSANPSVAGQQLTLTASVSGSSSFTPTGTVTFTSNGIAIAGCDAISLSTAQAQCTATFASTGSLSLQALYSGDDNFLTSSATLSQTVNRDATTTTVAVSSTSVAVGQSVAVTATVAPLAPGAGTQTGTVEFEDSDNVVDGCNAQSLALGVATCFTSFSTPGTHTLVAVYNGDANFDTSTSDEVAVTVGATTTTLASSANPSVAGNPVTYTATVAPQVPGGATPTGTVEFEDSGTVVDGCSAQSLVEGVATCNVVYPLSSTHTITAIYSGSTDHHASTSTDLTQTVGSGTLTLSESTAPSVGTPFIIDLSPVLLGSRQFQMSTGQLGTLQVDDNRGTEDGWSATAQLESNFINEQPSGAVADNTIPGDFLSWVPDVTAAVDGASMSGVSAGATSTLSDTTAVPLCSAVQGYGGSDYDCDASLGLSVPPYVAAGTYVAMLDIVMTSN